MESNPSQQSPEPQGVVLNRNHGKKGVFEIILIVFLLIITLVLLNYLNIIPLSAMFPNQLGWLPHRPEESNQATDTTIPPAISSDISLLEPAKETLINALPNILISSLIPNSSQEIKTTNNKIPESFNNTWTVNKTEASATLIVTPDGKSISQLHLSFQKDNSKPPSRETAPKLASEFFSVNPKGVWGCKPLNESKTSIIYCENFWEEKDGTKIGIGVQGLFTQGPALVNKSPEIFIFYCQRSKENKLYSWKSCDLQFSQTGVTP